MAAVGPPAGLRSPAGDVSLWSALCVSSSSMVLWFAPAFCWSVGVLWFGGDVPMVCGKPGISPLESSRVHQPPEEGLFFGSHAGDLCGFPGPASWARGRLCEKKETVEMRAQKRSFPEDSQGAVRRSRQWRK